MLDTCDAATLETFHDVSKVDKNAAKLMFRALASTSGLHLAVIHLIASGATSVGDHNTSSQAKPLSNHLISVAGHIAEHFCAISRDDYLSLARQLLSNPEENLADSFPAGDAKYYASKMLDSIRFEGTKHAVQEWKNDVFRKFRICAAKALRPSGDYGGDLGDRIWDTVCETPLSAEHESFPVHALLGIPTDHAMPLDAVLPVCNGRADVSDTRIYAKCIFNLQVALNLQGEDGDQAKVVARWLSIPYAIGVRFLDKSASSKTTVPRTCALKHIENAVPRNSLAVGWASMIQASFGQRGRQNRTSRKKFIELANRCRVYIEHFAKLFWRKIKQEDRLAEFHDMSIPLRKSFEGIFQLNKKSRQNLFGMSSQCDRQDVMKALSSNAAVMSNEKSGKEHGTSSDSSAEESSSNDF